MGDNVNHPDHYNMYEGLEIIDLVEQMNFNRGNSIKYLTRAGFKGGAANEIEDLKKAAWYLQREIERLEKKSPSVAVPVETKGSVVSAVKKNDSTKFFAYRINDANKGMIKKHNDGIEVSPEQGDYFLVSENGFIKLCVLSVVFSERYRIIETVHLSLERYVVEKTHR